MRAVLELGARPSRATLEAAIEGTTLADEVYLREHPSTPPLYASGVRYQPEPRRRERWLRIPEVMSRGHGDCEDLAAWRAAELRHKGEEARVVMRSGGAPGKWHAVVERADGGIEDPSRELGMGRSRR